MSVKICVYVSWQKIPKIICIFYQNSRWFLNYWTYSGLIEILFVSKWSWAFSVQLWCFCLLSKNASTCSKNARFLLSFDPLCRSLLFAFCRLDSRGVFDDLDGLFFRPSTIRRRFRRSDISSDSSPDPPLLEVFLTLWERIWKHDINETCSWDHPKHFIGLKNQKIY